MQFHVGRLIDHVHLRVADLEASKRFYRAVFVAIGRSDAFVEGQNHFSADELWVDKAEGPVSRVHLAFQAADRATVEAFYRAALSAGGHGNGAPGERSYHPGYYAAFVLDPDGNNIEAVFPLSARAHALVANAVQPNPSLEADALRHGTWPASRSGPSSASRAKRHTGARGSAQRLGGSHNPLCPHVPR